VAGNVQAAFLVSANVFAFAKSGQLKVLASTGRARLASTPAIPTLIESGFADFEAISWLGFMAPAATPKPVIERYHRELIRILRMPDLVERFGALDMEVVGSTPEEFGRFFRAEIPKWGKAIRQTGAKSN
jgi:tripartite-type tricarboxylate transporter receptor subunit TctC